MTTVKTGVVFMDCAVCTRPMRVHLYRVKRAKEPITCSRACRAARMRGAGHCNWKNGVWKDSRSGYPYVRTDTLSQADRQLLPWPVPRAVREHRLVIARSIGGWPEKREHVHHINGVKDDNRLENLV